MMKIQYPKNKTLVFLLIGLVFSMPLVDAASLDLEDGWNLVGFNSLPSDNSVGNVFASAPNTAVFGWDKSKGEWAIYLPVLGYERSRDYASENSLLFLDKIEYTRAYWVYSTDIAGPQSVTLCSSGCSPVPEGPSLSPGWNFVTFSNIKTPKKASSFLSGSVNQVWAYNHPSWSVYDSVNPAYSDLEYIEPNRGYWINVSDNILTAKITSPAGYNTFLEGDPISFNAAVSGGKPPYTYNWYWLNSNDPSETLHSFGNTLSMTKSDLPVIRDNKPLSCYLIFFKVVDSNGGEAWDQMPPPAILDHSILLRICDPVVSIASPSDGETFKVLDEVEFRSEYTDCFIDSSDFTWVSSIDGLLFNEDTFKTHDLSEGTHVITFTLESPELSSSDSVTIDVIASLGPNPLISEPKGKGAFQGVEPILFDSMVSGGTPPYTYLWSSDLDGVLGDAKSFSTTLSGGEHTITLEVTDSLGYTGSTSIILYQDVLLKAFDWSHKVLPSAPPSGGNWMSPVKDQGNCGSCWAFSAIGTIEAMYNIKNNNPNLNLDLSEQELFLCANGPGNPLVTGSFNYIEDNNGVLTENCLPYLLNCSAGIGENRCLPVCSTKYRLRDYRTFAGDEAMKSALKDGPFSVCLEWGGNAIQYEEGIGKCEGRRSTMDHCVVLVGYNDKEKYWIIKNSWGTGWGDNGYGKIGYGECGMGTKHPGIKVWV